MSRFETYEQTPTGQELAAIITSPEFVPEYVAVSRIGKPAVQAVAADVRDIIEALPTKEARDEASQFVGWRVAQVMRGLGYELIQKRGRVANAPYRTGAVWQYEPGRVRVAMSIPEGIRRKVEVFVQPGTGEVLADISARDEPTPPAHTMTTILGIKVRYEDAVAKAKTYAERHGYGYVHVLGELSRLNGEQLQALR